VKTAKNEPEVRIAALEKALARMENRVSTLELAVDLVIPASERVVSLAASMEAVLKKFGRDSARKKEEFARIRARMSKPR
jgi:hypothetical protein